MLAGDGRSSCGWADHGENRRHLCNPARVGLSASREQVAHVTFDSGELGGRRVVLAAAGMGKVNAGLVATLLADRFDCNTIVFTGVAGGLDPQLHIGDIVIADRIVQHDFGLIHDESR